MTVYISSDFEDARGRRIRTTVCRMDLRGTGEAEVQTRALQTSQHLLSVCVNRKEKQNKVIITLCASVKQGVRGRG